jgi:beta-mannosidase
MADAQSLSGPWVVHPGDRELVKTFAEPDYDDRDWVTIDVPAHWRDSDAFVDHDDSLLYRRRFRRDRLDWGRRAWLEFDGIFYFGDVWLDGDYLGPTEGYFGAHRFEVTEQLLTDEEHVVAVEVACPRQFDRTAKRTITGVFGHWDAMDDTWNPGGIWRHVRLRETGLLCISRARIICLSASSQEARVRVDTTVDAGNFPPETALIRAAVLYDGVELAVVERELTPAQGSTDLQLEIAVPNPPLWWPANLGAQSLVDVEVRVDVGGTESDRHATRTGLREVGFDDWIFTINGVRQFIRGANTGPVRQSLASVTVDDARRDVQLALDANLNLLRVHAHVTVDSFYEAADELGLLVWQDFPLQWGYGRSTRRSAVTQARAMVDRLGHHPSIVTWCAHNEPLAVDVTADAVTPAVAARVGASMMLPSWNKSVLDRRVAHALRAADPSRFVNDHSGVLPGPASLGTDSHLYFGWYWGAADQLPRALRAVPRIARFVSEFGAQAVPASVGFCEIDRWPELDWDRLESHHCLQRRLLDSRVPIADHATFAAWQQATQEYQAALLQLQIEDLRRLKYTPTGGYCMFSFADAHPAISWSILDHERIPKLAYHAVAAASRPLLAMVDPRTGDVHVVNDTLDRFDHATVEVDVDGVVRRFAGTIEPDSLTWVGGVEIQGGEAITATLVPRIGVDPIRHGIETSSLDFNCT